MGVAEPVEREPGQTRRLHQAVVDRGGRVRVEQGPVLPCEHQAVGGPRATERQPVLSLLGLPRPERRHRLLVQVHPASLPRLGLPVDHLHAEGLKEPNGYDHTLEAVFAVLDRALQPPAPVEPRRPGRHVPPDQQNWGAVGAALTSGGGA